jgi:hypothetical protein
MLFISLSICERTQLLSIQLSMKEMLSLHRFICIRA